MFLAFFIKPQIAHLRWNIQHKNCFNLNKILRRQIGLIVTSIERQAMRLVRSNTHATYKIVTCRLPKVFANKGLLLTKRPSNRNSWEKSDINVLFEYQIWWIVVGWAGQSTLVHFYAKKLCQRRLKTVIFDGKTNKLKNRFNTESLSYYRSICLMAALYLWANKQLHPEAKCH